jgi:short-subunit dehydrogenase
MSPAASDITEEEMAKNRHSLSGKVVAITGGARGIGKATAAALVNKGCRVAIGDLDLELAEKTAAHLGGGTVALPLAGIMPVTPFEEESEDSIRRQVDINLIGVITGTQLAVRRFRQRGSGHIVNIASQAGKSGIPGIATYSGTKHAVVGLSEAVRAELRGSGVEVSCVMPTVVNTELTSGVGQKWIKPVEASDVADEIVDALEAPRFDVFVPRANGILYKILTPLPRSWREAIGRAMKVDKLMLEVDHNARRAYEERAAKSEPGQQEGIEERPTSQRDVA